MPLDGTILGNVAQEQMQALEDIYGDDESAEVGAVLTIVQIIKREGDAYTSAVRMRHNVADPYTAIGLVRAAEQTIIQQIQPGTGPA